MLDQVVTTFSVSILTKEKGNALALRKYDKRLQHFDNKKTKFS